jgi:hypothetical protein
MMERFIAERPELWWEDIGADPEPGTRPAT